MNTKARIALIIGIALLSIASIGIFIFNNIYKSHASQGQITALFQESTLTIGESGEALVDVLFNSSANQVSAATVSIIYPPALLEYDNNAGNSTTCTSNNAKLTTKVKVENDTTNGILKITRLAKDKMNTALPSGLFCFGTVGFRVKAGISIPSTATITLQDPVQNSWEAVGPQGTYTTQIDSQHNSVAVSIVTGGNNGTPPPPLVCRPNFPDIQPSDPFYPSIACLFCRNIIHGERDGNFHVNDPIKRGEMAQILVTAAGWPIITPQTPSFSDVSQSNIFYGAIETLKTHGIVGYSDGTFKPNNAILRGEAAIFLSVAKGYTDAPPTQPSFLDVPTNSVFYQSVEQLKMHSVTNGYPDHTFKPTVSLKRGEATQFVSAAFFPTCSVPPTPGNTSVSLKLKFQGVIQKPSDAYNSMTVKVTALNNTGTTRSTKSAIFTADAQGIWTGNVNFDLPSASGPYKLLVKGPKHLQKRVCDSTPTETFAGTYHCDRGNIILNPGDNALDFSGIYLLSGDLPEQDGIVNSFDTSLILNSLGKSDADSLRFADVNLDGIVNAQDYSLVIAALSVRNDEGD